jgi:flagellum-specific peptidoglycan hydrolase FlgJ
MKIYLFNKKNILIGTGVLIVLFLLTKKKKITKMITGSNKDFINLIKPYAISIGNKIGIPPLFIMAQLVLESGWGKSSLTAKYFNFGGIKARKGEPFVTMITPECKGNVCKNIPQNFRKFNNIQEGMEAQTKIYQNVNFRQYLNKTTNPIEYAKLLQSGTRKYATSPNYVKNITSVLETIKNI